jgi:ATP-dependent RNA helicase DeaD
MTASFNDFNLDKNILRAIHEMGFEEPSPIQSSCIPMVLEGIDVIGQAQTGTGKTAAFGIPVIERVTSKPVVQALILAPTRELAIQVSGELRKIAKFKRIKTLPIYGGQSIGHQIRALKQGVQVVIGTPGRILDHLSRNTLRLDEVKMVVLDEADEMLDMGFIEDIEAILKSVPTERQTLLFSATMPPEIRALANRYMKNPKVVRVNREEVTAPLIDQVYYKVFERNKLDSLCRILDAEEVELGIIFCRTKKGVDELVESLQARGYMADGLHGDLSQAQRDKVMGDFRQNRIEFLVATDVAARGIDVSNVSHVINYDIPQDPESYVHRIGRTGRAGKRGLAITLVTPREMKQLRVIEKEIKTSLIPKNLPTVEEANVRRAEQFKRQVEELIEENHIHPVVKEMVDALKREYSPEQLAYAIAQIAMNDQLMEDKEEQYDFGDTGAQKGMVRFFINVGKNINLSPKSLAEELSSLVGIPSNSIGKIDIFDRFTFVEVPEEVAPFLYEALRQGRLQGARVNVEPAKPRGK